MYSGRLAAQVRRAAPPRLAASPDHVGHQPLVARPRPRAPTTTASRTPGCAAQRAPRSRPARCGSRAPSPASSSAAQELQRPVRPPARPVAGAVQPRARPRRRTDRGRSAPPSAPAGPGSRAPPRRRRCTARPARRPAPAASRASSTYDARVRRSAGRSAARGRRRAPVRTCATWSTTVVSVGPYTLQQPRARRVAQPRAQLAADSASPPDQQMRAARRRQPAPAGDQLQRRGRQVAGVVDPLPRAARASQRRGVATAPRLRHAPARAPGDQRREQLPDARRRS